ncbi:MAG: ABC transporter permease [Salinispira sp.]
MNKHWIFLTARRFIHSRKRSRSSVTALLSIFGLAAGITTLTTVISVTNGLQQSTIEDLIEINSFHLRLRPPFPDTAENIETIPGISEAFPIIETQALFRGGRGRTQAVILKALDSRFLQENTEFSYRLGLFSRPPLDDRTVIVGRELARFLGIERGDRIYAIGLGGDGISLNNPIDIELTVSELFASGYYDFDRNWAFINLNTAEQDFQSAYRTELAINIDDRLNDLSIVQKLRSRYPDLRGENVQSWREFNRSIFGALRLEKTILAFLIGLIFLVVGVNIFQGLKRTVHDHYEDIAILKTLGASERNVRMVFLCEGLLIALGGILIGLPGGIWISTGINEIFRFAENVVGFIQDKSTFQVFSPSYFYLQNVPVHIIPAELAAIALVAAASAIFSAYAASRQVLTLRPREVFNNE